MKETLHDGRPSAHGTLRFLLHQGLPLERETVLFFVASAMDFVMTWFLLNYQTQSGRVWFVESNPIARYFLYSWGFDGLIGFKFATVVFVAVICQIIARSRLATARRLLMVATVVVLAVVAYSGVLLVKHT